MAYINRGGRFELKMCMTTLQGKVLGGEEGREKGVFRRIKCTTREREILNYRVTSLVRGTNDPETDREPRWVHRRSKGRGRMRGGRVLSAKQLQLARLGRSGQ